MNRADSRRHPARLRFQPPTWKRWFPWLGTHDPTGLWRAKMGKRADRVIVATDDDRIVKAVQGFGGEAALTARPPNRDGKGAEVAAH